MADLSENLRLIKYGCLQATIGPSLLCDICVFIYLIRHWRKEIVKSPQNHVILCVLTVSFIEKMTDAIFSLYFFRWGISILQTETFCTVWTWLNYSLLTVNLMLIAWCCIERHLFIFHSQRMKRKLYLNLFHYLPLLLCLCYTPTLYIVLIFFPSSCTNTWDYTYPYCGSPCYAFVPLWGTYDWLAHYALPISIISLANLFLFVRVVWQRIKQGRPVEWNRQKRMIIQLVFISALYLMLITPEVIVGVIEALWSPTFALDIQLNYFFYITNFVHQLLPFIIITSLPKLHKELKQSFQRIRRVYPLEAMNGREQTNLTRDATNGKAI
ncbi:unnamed protein product [Adineta ricciae]|uniref:G-protein coupled receptors family 1 profile domain-containing protein n=1 Tax=Adineta ricciae TaxID=249248 RepID=A0A814JNF0_ADIRI|nr:unnamed protein product [Adineta ricciae]CAF1037950.1 unnamed protein product [Adineta ricciae]